MKLQLKSLLNCNEKTKQKLFPLKKGCICVKCKQTFIKWQTIKFKARKKNWSFIFNLIWFWFIFVRMRNPSQTWVTSSLATSHTFVWLQSLKSALEFNSYTKKLNVYQMPIYTEWMYILWCSVKYSKSTGV